MSPSPTENSKREEKMTSGYSPPDAKNITGVGRNACGVCGAGRAMAMPARQPAPGTPSMHLVVTSGQSQPLPHVFALLVPQSCLCGIAGPYCAAAWAIPARRLRDTRLGRRSPRVVGISVRDASWPVGRLYDGA
jgi:hypothetical protein